MPSGTINWKPLEAALGGEVVLPGSDLYDDLRAAWNGMIDIHPAAIALCSSTDEVRHSVDFAVTNGIEMSIRGGGHNAAGLCLVEDGLVIDLRKLQQVAIDAGASTARAGGGTVWATFDAATAQHGLATTGGVISTTGCSGLTFGGGIGSLMREYGLACDNLIGAQVVLANSDIVYCSADLNPDLLWGLRGGGGNFGVVTEMTYSLHPVTNVVGGLILHPRAVAMDAFKNYREVTANSPKPLSVFFGLLCSPEGDQVCGYSVCYNGSESAAAGPLQPLRGFGTPIADMTAEVPYTQQQQMLDEGFPPGLPVYWKAAFLTGLPDEAMQTMVDFSNKAPSPLSVVLVEHLGGEVAEVPNDATAFDHRDAEYNLAIIARWLDPADQDKNIAWAREFFDAMKPWSAGVYANYLSNADAPDRIKDAFSPAKMAEIAAVKKTYDPDNLFRRNQNIAPR